MKAGGGRDVGGLTAVVSADTPEPRVGGFGGGAVRPMSGGVLRSSQRGSRPGSAAVSVATTGTSSSAGVTDEGTSPPRESRASSTRADDDDHHPTRQKGAPRAHFQRPDSSRGERIQPAPSVSKTGLMSELAVGTRQLARAGQQALAASKVKRTGKGGGGFVPVDLDLDEFGKGAQADSGPHGQRHKELVSSPRHDLRIREREQHSSQGVKASKFCQSMALKYASDGSPLEKPPPDPIDQKYARFGLRRPLSSRQRAAMSPSAGSVEDDPLDVLDAALRSPHTEYGDSELTKPALAFLTRAESAAAGRGGHVPKDDGAPCVGHYMPRFGLVTQRSAGAPRWDRTVTIPRSRPPKPARTRPASAPPAPGEQQSIHNMTVQSMASGLASDFNATSRSQVAGPEKKEGEGAPPTAAPAKKQAGPITNEPLPSACFLTPGRDDLHMDSGRKGEVRTTRAWRPNPYYPAAGSARQTGGADVCYWPYNCQQKRILRPPLMRLQVGREEASRTGYTLVLSGSGGCGPDAVYDGATAAKNSQVAAPPGNLDMSRQVPYDTSSRQLNKPRERFEAQEGYRDYDLDKVRKAPRQPRDWKKAPELAKAQPLNHAQGDARKPLEVESAWRSTRPKVQSGCTYDLQTARPQLLRPNPYIQLEYDAKRDLVQARPPITDFTSRTAR
eukprot:Hpha_TRINITY_DN15334_c4_g11::TRINITY_DN15334_c4_g11_i1::g.90779::m.90779